MKIMPWFADRVLPLTAATSEYWGNVAAQSKAKGRPRPVVDALRAATAFKRDLILATRNVRDYEDLGVTILSHRRKYRLDLHRQPPYRRLPPLDYERPAVFKSSLRL